MVTLVLTPDAKDAGNVKFSVDGQTGKGKPAAKREDALLVQFCLQLLRESGAGFAPQIPQQTLNGDPTDQAMIDGIIAFQKQSPAMAQDGFCSPFHSHAYGKPGVFTLSLMQGTIIARNTPANAVWPRLDRLGNCPTELGAIVKREIGIMNIISPV
jgi:hypothetical protein